MFTITTLSASGAALKIKFKQVTFFKEFLKKQLLLKSVIVNKKQVLPALVSHRWSRNNIFDFWDLNSNSSISFFKSLKVYG